MLNSFWASLEIDDVSDLKYTDYVQYKTSEQKEEVLEKIDWVILKLHKIKDIRKYDFDIVSRMKDKIKYGDSSLTLKGVEYLNLITVDLKQDTF
jgi:hypothetical protein